MRSGVISILTAQVWDTLEQLQDVLLPVSFPFCYLKSKIPVKNMIHRGSKQAEAESVLDMISRIPEVSVTPTARV
ncbi:MAG: hypothetical protein GQ559_01155 [Desulfobulbaceae bacterium]|nr:hypothetical protein [Desulfobulbaceae bacterium]